MSAAADGREVVIVGGGPVGMSAALEARRAGVQATLIEERPTLGGQIYKQPPAAFTVRRPRAMGKEYLAGRPLVERTRRSGAEVLAGHVVWNVSGSGPFDVGVYRLEGGARTFRAEHLVLATGAYDRPVPFPGWTLEDRGGHVPVRDADMQSSVPGVFVVGDGAGVAGSAVAIEEGRIAGIAAARALGRLDRAAPDERLRPRRRRLAQLERFHAALDETYRVGPGIYEWATDETIVCRCEEVTVGEVRRNIRPGSRDPNAVKSLTRVGMGLCQGHNCSHQVSAIFARESGRPLEQLPPFSPRPPVRPVPIGLIADTSVTGTAERLQILPEIEVSDRSAPEAVPGADR